MTELRRFLELVFGDEAEELFSRGEIVIALKDEGQFTREVVGDLNTVEQALTGLEGDYYIKVNRLDSQKIIARSQWGIGGRSEVTELRAIVLDVDTEEAKPGQGYPKRDEILLLLDVMGWSPTLVVDSGSGGLHLYWVLDDWRELGDEAAREWAGRVCRAWNDKVNGLSEKWNIDATCQPERLLRVAGTKRGDGNEVKLISTGREYLLTELVPDDAPNLTQEVATVASSGSTLIKDYLIGVGYSSVTDYLMSRWGWDAGLCHPRAVSGSASGKLWVGQNGEEGITIHSSSNDLVKLGLEAGKWYSLANLFVTTEFGGDWKRAAAYVRGKSGGAGVVVEGCPFDDYEIEQRKWTAEYMARRVMRKLHGRFVYVYEHAMWYVWDGARWVEDPNHVRLKERIAHILLEMEDDYPPGLDGGEYKKWRNFVNRYSPDNIEKKLQRQCQIRSYELDADPGLCFPSDRKCSFGGQGVKSGILDCVNGLTHANVLGTLNTKLAGTDIADVVGGRWLAFLDEITGGDKELQEYLGRVAGYCLTNETLEEKMFVLVGEGANGKSLFVEMISRAMGDYAQPVRSELVETTSGGSEASYEVASLDGVRLACVEETNYNCRLADARVKQLVTPGVTKVREPYQKPKAMTLVCKLMLTTNHVPQIIGSEEGVWRRVVLVPFDQYFDPESRDLNLREKLAAELDGILRWMVDGLIRYRREGLVREPACVRDKHKTVRTEMDIIGNWLADRCCEEEQLAKLHDPWTEFELLMGDFRDYCSGAGLPLLSSTRLGRELSKRGIEAKKIEGVRKRRLILRSSGAAKF